MESRLEYSKIMVTLTTAIMTVIVALRIALKSEFTEFYSNNSSLFSFIFIFIIFSLLLSLVGIYLKRFDNYNKITDIIDAIAGILLFIGVVLFIVLIATS